MHMMEPIQQLAQCVVEALDGIYHMKRAVSDKQLAAYVRHRSGPAKTTEMPIMHQAGRACQAGYRARRPGYARARRAS